MKMRREHGLFSCRRQESRNSEKEQHGVVERSAARPGPQRKRLHPNALDNLRPTFVSHPAAARDVPRISHHGFTLMEVMLALAISAVVLAGIGGVFYSAVRLRERTNAMLDESAPLQHAFNFIRHDLQGALPPGGTNLPLAGDFKLQALGSGLGQNYHIEFFTTSGAVNDNTTWSDIQFVSYELRDSNDRTRNNSGKDLVRNLNRNVLATAMVDPQEQPLLSNVQSLEFSCFDGVNWRDSWDTSLGDTNLPYAVRVRIQLAGDSGSSRAQDPFEIVVPVVSQSRTNVPQTTASGS